MFVIYTKNADSREGQWAIKIEGKEVVERYILGYTYDAIEGYGYFHFEKVENFSIEDAAGIMSAIASGHVECSDTLS